MRKLFKSMWVCLTGLLFIASFASAAVVFTDDFETPDVTSAQSDGNTSGAINSDNWVKASNGFGSGRQGTVDEAHGDFTDPAGEQAYAFRYTNSGITTTFGSIGSAAVGTVITVNFDVVMDGHNSTTPYLAALVTFDGAGTRNRINGGVSDNVSSVLATTSGNSTTDGSYTNVEFSYTIDSADDAAVIGHDIALRFDGATSTAIIDNVTVDVVAVPEASAALLGCLGALMLLRRRRA